MAHPGNPPPYTETQQSIQMVQVQPAPGAHVISNAVPVVVGRPMGTDPVMIVCSSCGYQILTRTETRPTTRTHLWAICLLLIGCWPCMCIPYCTPACMNVNHYCPSCNSFIGSYNH